MHLELLLQLHFDLPFAATSNATGVNDLVCAMVAAEAKRDPANVWAAYSRVFLSSEVQDLIQLRLDTEPAQPPPSNERTTQNPMDNLTTMARALPAPAEDPTGATADDISLSFSCVNGDSFLVAVPCTASVANVKVKISQMRGTPTFEMELFRLGHEDALRDEQLLEEYGLEDGAKLFMLLRPCNDKQALEAFYISTGGVNWRRQDGWLTDAPIGEWYGVDASADGRVTKLRLDENNLAGRIPKEVAQLISLHTLSLELNKLDGPIPSELGQLQALEGLFLNSNQLTGAPSRASVSTCSWTGNCARLTGKCVLLCCFAGELPAELGQCSALCELEVSQNGLVGASQTVECSAPSFLRVVFKSAGACFQVQSRERWGCFPS